MALIICEECNKEYSDRAPACPNCGCPTSVKSKNIPIKSFDEALEATKTAKVINAGNIRAAKKIIFPNENVLFACCCNVSTTPILGKLSPKVSIKNKTPGILAITDKRIIFANDTLGIGVGQSKELFIKNITSIDSVGTIFATQLRIQGVTEMFVIDCNSKLREKITNAISTVRNI